MMFEEAIGWTAQERHFRHLYFGWRRKVVVEFAQSSNHELIVTFDREAGHRETRLLTPA